MSRLLKLIENSGMPGDWKVPLGTLVVEVPQSNWDSWMWGCYEELVRKLEPEDLAGFVAIAWLSPVHAVDGFYASYRFEEVVSGEAVVS